jgi:hypothetical protein
MYYKYVAHVWEYLTYILYFLEQLISSNPAKHSYRKLRFQKDAFMEVLTKS